MDEVLSPTEETVSTDTVYRNQARALFEEPEDLTPDEKRQTRVSARFDRSSWSPEFYHAFEPTRSLYAPKKVNTQYNQHSFGANGASQPAVLEPVQKVHTREALEAVQTHGTYRLLEVKRTESEKGLVVMAQCTGSGCGGQAIRKFRAREWLDLSENKSCPQCRGVLMMREADERYRKTVNATHGLWVFESMTRMNGNKAMTVTGVCTGPVCGGWKRNFQFNHWQGTRVAMAGCHRCCEIMRSVAAANEQERRSA
jgi:hypothetical protein